MVCNSGLQIQHGSSIAKAAVAEQPSARLIGSMQH
jgi:hypothetical protein